MEKQQNEKIELLKEIFQYFERVEKNLLNVCENIRNGEGLGDVPNFIEGMLSAAKVIKFTEDIHGLSFDNEMFTNLSGDILEGMENGDCGLIADILEYEFLPYIKDWIQKLKEVF